MELTGVAIGSAEFAGGREQVRSNENDKVVQIRVLMNSVPSELFKKYPEDDPTFYYV